MIKHLFRTSTLNFDVHLKTRDCIDGIDYRCKGLAFESHLNIWSCFLLYETLGN